MSVYIHGMEMPTHCLDCPFMVSRDGDDCILQSAEANENFENWEQMKAGCPLIPVPPHGDLIDKSGFDVLSWNEKDEGGFIDGVLFVLDKLDKQPVIIPAERGREMKPCYGKCSRCVWYRNGGCSEWRYSNGLKTL